MNRQRSEADITTNQSSKINELPNEILELIFIRIPPKHLVKNVVLVCKKWNEIIESNDFWTERLLNELKITKELIKYLKDKSAYEPKKLYFKNPYTKNLIKNGCAEKGYDFWIVVENNYSGLDLFVPLKKKFRENFPNNFQTNTANLTNLNGFKIEDSPSGSKQAYDEHNNKIKVYATTHFKCLKYQIIDLYKEGVDPVILDKLKPKIEISDMYAARFDCGCEYHLRVYLLDTDFNLIDSVIYDKTFPQWDEAEWHTYRHVFENYSNDLRYIIFVHGGKDTQFWAGHYGIKVTNSNVKFILN